jgi:hypothetical protein
LTTDFVREFMIPKILRAFLRIGLSVTSEMVGCWRCNVAQLHEQLEPGYVWHKQYEHFNKYGHFDHFEDDESMPPR